MLRSGPSSVGLHGTLFEVRLVLSTLSARGPATDFRVAALLTRFAVGRLIGSHPRTPLSLRQLSLGGPRGDIRSTKARESSRGMVRALLASYEAAVGRRADPSANQQARDDRRERRRAQTQLTRERVGIGG